MSWSDHLAAADIAVASYFDETPCRLQPRTKGLSVNYADVDDPDRTAFDFLGTIDLEPPADRLTRHMSADPGVRNGTVSYDAVLTALTTLWPYEPKRGDHLISGGVTWKIAANEKDGSDRPAWYLNKA
ncbi:hypothetical protein [Pseudorhizobium pelagicum]|uniref:hypothetical protein n=1 Tax=Pseudorhizobium pelagicum TaxID=1509405 RepID=UPI002989CEF4